MPQNGHFDPISEGRSHILRTALALGELFDGGAVFFARKEADEVFAVGEPRQRVEREKERKEGDRPAA